LIFLGRAAHLFAVPLLAAPAAPLGINQAGASAAAAGVIGHTISSRGLFNLKNANSIWPFGAEAAAR
jgi:hypothetical protein